MFTSPYALSSLIVLLLLPLLQALAANGAVLQPIGSQTIVEDDFIYARAADVELRAHSYRPKAQGPFPAIIDVHGGAWSSGERMQDAHYDRALASSGLYVLAIDFRQAPGAQHPAANADIAAAVRYLRSNAARLDIDPASIGLVGSSSGGHLVMLAGLTPNREGFRGTQISTGKGFAPADTIDAGVRYVIALWPVSDPEYRYEYARKAGRAELAKSHEDYFGTRELMRQASVPRLLRAKEAAQVPPFMVVQPGNDANIPREMTFDLLSAYQDAGGRATYLFYPGERHGFGRGPSASTDHMIVAMRDFIEQILIRAP